MSRAAVWLVASAAWFILAGALAAPAGAASVSTNDGLVLTLNANGSWNSLTVDGNPVPALAGVTGGFVVARMEGVQIPYQRNTFYPGTPITGVAAQEGNNVRLTATTEGLSFNILLTGGGPYLGVDGTVTGPGTDRSCIVYFRIPVNAATWTWWDDVVSKRTIASGASYWYFTNYHFHQARHPDLSLNPFGAITKTTAPAMGLSLAPLFYPPSAYAIQYNSQGGFWIEFELGLTPLTTKHPNSADFHFVLYKHDPRWGERSAVKRYYGFFPSWFARVSPGGNWMLDGTRPTTPSDFAIKYLEGYNWSDAYTISNNIYTCKYQEPWCWHLEWLDDVTLEQKALDIPENDPYYCPAKGQSIKESAQQAILSGCKNPDGSYIGPDDLVRWSDGTWDCDGVIETVRYVTNPDVEIANWRGFNPGRNRGQSVEYWEWYKWWGMDPGPNDYYTGLYHDSVGGGWSGWGAVHNMTPEHWAYYDYNAGIFQDYDWPSSVGNVCMWAAFSNIEFAKYAKERMAMENRVVMANSSATYELFMVAPFLDMIGAGESYAADAHGQGIMRAIAYHKPMSYLGGARTETAIKDCLVFGIYPGFADGSSYESYRTLYRKYMPILNALDAAGWEPVTNAVSSVSTVRLERHGPAADGVLYFVVRCPARAKPKITVSSADMGWPANPNVTVTELIYGDPVSKSFDGNGNLIITCGTIGRNDDRVYKIVPNF